MECERGERSWLQLARVVRLCTRGMVPGRTPRANPSSPGGRAHHGPGETGVAGEAVSGVDVQEAG